MISGSLDANHGEPNGVRIDARRPLTVLAGLAAVTCCLASAAAESASVVEEPRALLAQYAAGLKQVPVMPEWPPSAEASELLLPEEGASEPEIGYLLPRRDGLLSPGVRRVGPVRRWFHGLFDGRFAVVGAERPLLREDWRFRPFSIGWFMGGVSGSPLLDDWVDQKSGYFAGYRIGWDYSRYWGCEMRLGFGYLELADSQRAIEAQESADSHIDLPGGDPFFSRFDQRRDSDLILWDVSLLYYPWGNTNWRPYFLAGLGAARVDFLDRLSERRAETVFEMPLGMGVKHRYRDWLALRFEMTDNVVFGQKFNTVHDLSFTGGVEILFGGTRKAYWPWNPGRHYW
jgi:hypothetical protein